MGCCINPRLTNAANGKVKPLFKAVAEYRVWLTGLRGAGAEQDGAKNRLLRFQAGRVLSLRAGCVDERDVWYACEQLSIPLVALLARGTLQSAASVLLAS